MISFNATESEVEEIARLWPAGIYRQYTDRLSDADLSNLMVTRMNRRGKIRRGVFHNQ